METCSFPDCGNKRMADRDICKSHRRVELTEGALRPLKKRSRQQSPVCTGPGCDRPSVAHDLCKSHGDQLRKYGALHRIGDPVHRAERFRQTWAKRTQEERSAHLAAMRAGRKAVTEEARHRLSESKRAEWADRKARSGGPAVRPCLTCGAEFAPPDWRVYYCSLECKRLYARLRHHGLTYAEYVAILERQGHACALCGRTEGGWSRTAIDHCHRTGRVRGILCGDCNTALGRFGDDPVLLRKAAAYLEE